MRGEVYDTLQRHRRELLDFARRNKLKILDIYEEVVSADTIEDRPEIQKMIECVKDGKYQAVLVIAYDRLGRGDKVDQGIIERVFKKSDTIIITPKDTIDLNDERGEMTADFEGFLARMEYRKIKGRLRDGLNRAVLEGKNMSHPTPFGYGKDENCILQVIPEEAKVVKLIFEKSVAGFGSHAISSDLSNLGLRTRNGNVFIPKAIRDIIRNAKYKGDQFYGIHTKNPIYVEDCHEPIIDRETWKIANDRINSRAPVNNEDAPMQNPLATILICSECGATLRRVKSERNGETYTYFYCKSSWCSVKGSRYELVMDTLLNALKDILHNIEVDNENLIVSDDIVILKDKCSGIQNEINGLEDKRDNIHDMLENKVYSQDVFLHRMNKVDEQEKKLALELKELNDKINIEESRTENAKNLAPAITNALSIFNQCNAEQKNRLLKSFIDKIYYAKKNKEDRFFLDVILRN